MVRQARIMAVVRAFLIGSVVLLAVSCAGVRSEAPTEEKQGHTEATKQEQAHTPEPTPSEEARCGGTRTIDWYGESIVTNDVPGCPTGGLLSGTDKPDTLEGRDGDDEIQGLGAKDNLIGGSGSDVIYGGPGSDEIVDAISGGDDVLYGGDGDDLYVMGGKGEDVIYGGDGNDFIDGATADRQQRDKLYCGEGRDQYVADEIDYTDSSCEIKTRLVGRTDSFNFWKEHSLVFAPPIVRTSENTSTSTHSGE